LSGWGALKFSPTLTLCCQEITSRHQSTQASKSTSLSNNASKQINDFQRPNNLPEAISRLAIMSSRLLSARRVPPLAQRASSQTARHFHHHPSAGGLLRSRETRRKIWPAGTTQFSNAVIVRNASFARVIPNILMKFARIPALFAGATITGLAYVQYQATRMLYLSISL
jgi:hypothetical protein